MAAYIEERNFKSEKRWYEYEIQNRDVGLGVKEIVENRLKKSSLQSSKYQTPWRTNQARVRKWVYNGFIDSTPILVDLYEGAGNNIWSITNTEQSVSSQLLL